MSSLKGKDRLKFVLYAIENGICDASKKYAINRKTVSKWVARYKKLGEDGLLNLSRKEQEFPNKMPLAIETQILDLRKEKGWGAKKIKAFLDLRYAETTIDKKIRNAELTKKYNHNDEFVSFSRFFKNYISPFEGIIVTTRKIQYKKEIKELPKFMILAFDINSGLLNISYSFEKSKLFSAVFIDYLSNIFEMNDVKTDRLNFMSGKKGSFTELNKKTKLEEAMVEKYNVAFFDYKIINKFIKNDIDIIIKELNKNIFNTPLTKDINLLLAKTYSYLIYYNKEKKKKTRYDMSPYQILKEANYTKFKELTTIPPIVADKFLSYFDLTKSRIGYFGMYSKNIDLVKKATLNFLNLILKKEEDKFNNDGVLEIYEKQLIISNEESFEKKILYKKGNLLRSIGKWDESEVLFNDFLSSLEKSNDIKEQIKILNELGILKFDKGLYNKALEYFDKSLSLSLKENNQDGIFFAEYYIASIHFQKNNSSKAKAYMLKAYKHSKNSSDINKKIRLFGLLGNIFFNEYDYKNSLKQYIELYNIGIENKNNKAITVSLGNMCVVYQIMGRFKKAILCANEKLEIEKKIGASKGLVISYGNLANIYYQLTEYSNSLDYYKNQLDLAQELGFAIGIIQALCGIGNAYYLLKKLEKAEEYYLQMFEKAKLIEADSYLLTAYENLGDLYYKQKKYTQAEIYFEKLLELAAKNNAENELRQAKTSLNMLKRQN